MKGKKSKLHSYLLPCHVALAYKVVKTLNGKTFLEISKNFLQLYTLCFKKKANIYGSLGTIIQYITLT